MERLRACVLGIDDDCIHSHCRACAKDAADRVEQQHLTEPAALLPPIDGDTAKYRGRYRIMRQTLRRCRLQFISPEARRAQTIVPGNPSRRLTDDSDEYLSHAPPHVLRGPLLKVGVEGRFPARKGSTIMLPSERLDDQRRLIHQYARDSGVPPSSASRSA